MKPWKTSSQAILDEAIYPVSFHDSLEEDPKRGSIGVDWLLGKDESEFNLV